MSIVQLIDSYSESNANSSVLLGNGGNNSGYFYLGQTFINTSTNQMIISTCKFYLKKSNSPTGYIVAKVWAHTGTFGIDGKPTGTPLATSDEIDASTISSSYQLVTFTFSGINKTILSPNTYYCLGIFYSINDDITNRITLGIDTSSPSHDGNHFISVDTGDVWNGNFFGSNSYDIPFYVYGTLNVNYFGLDPVTTSAMYTNSIGQRKKLKLNERS